MNNENPFKIKLQQGEDGLLKKTVHKEAAPKFLKRVDFIPNDEVLVLELIPVGETKVGGILVDDKTPKAIIVAVGKTMENKYKAGQVVALGNIPQPIYIGGEMFVVAYDHYVMGTYTNMKFDYKPEPVVEPQVVITGEGTITGNVNIDLLPVEKKAMPIYQEKYDGSKAPEIENLKLPTKQIGTNPKKKGK